MITEGNEEGKIQKSRDEIIGELYPTHKQDEDGRGGDSISAYRHWSGGPKLVRLASGDEVKVYPGEWVVTIDYDVDVWDEEKKETVRVIKSVTLPFPDDAVRSLFGHLFASEESSPKDFSTSKQKSKEEIKEEATKGETLEEIKARQQRELEELNQAQNL